MDGPTQLERIRAWLAQGRRRLYAGGAAASILIVALVLAFEPSARVSTGKVQELLNSTYNTRSAACVARADGRDLCRLATERCRGTLLVKPVDEEIFTIVTATPARLRSTEACANPETLTPQ
jgi:hypothetical protein